MAKQASAERPSDEATEADRDAELEGGRMPFLSHLAELRDRVRNAALCFMAAFLICWGFADRIFAWLREPLFDIWAQHSGPGIEMLVKLHILPPGEDWGRPRLIYTGLTQPFWVNMSVALWAGIFVASPFIFYQLWRFIAPGLYKRERKITISFATLSAVFFVAGALFCFYFALPALFRYMLHYNSQDLESLPNIQDYLDLTRDSMLAFGAIFEMPLLIYFLAMVGLVTHRGLWKFSRWFVVLAFVIGAVLTPGPDVVSQFLMAMPMIVLYNISILFAWRVTVRRERAEAEQRAREAATVPQRKASGEIDSRDD
ncbi:MAG TPA: twin-arginine translocase subunit TatC [Kofleriaceae bacterium]|nr:twin-arginine translocase subunit TatC [Kofleriaceae bacterium]